MLNIFTGANRNFVQDCEIWIGCDNENGMFAPYEVSLLTADSTKLHSWATNSACC
jgi:hypothetical protein